MNYMPEFQKPKSDDTANKGAKVGENPRDRFLDEALSLTYPHPTQLANSLERAFRNDFYLKGSDSDNDGFLNIKEVDQAGREAKSAIEKAQEGGIIGVPEAAELRDALIDAYKGYVKVLGEVSKSTVAQEAIAGLSFDGANDAKGISKTDLKRLENLKYVSQGCDCLEMIADGVWPLNDDKFNRLEADPEISPSLKLGIREARELMIQNRLRVGRFDHIDFSRAEIDAVRKQLKVVKENLPTSTSDW